jgi:anti-sigma factor (TIGR02949 family)
MPPPSECSHVIALLSDYLDGRLRDDVRRDLEQHLSGCSDCTAFLGSFRATVELVRSLSEDDLPESLRMRLKAFLADRSTS